MDLAGRQEAHYAKNATYTTDRRDLNFPQKSPEEYYNININIGNATSYRLTAVAQAKGGQNQDKIKRFRLHSDGRKQYDDGSSWSNGWSGR
ncbi:MAG: type IV pilin protein [Xanthomonadales bacterium]|nr:type IV pilin protein [Xanthomonadales bacterium]